MIYSRASLFFSLFFFSSRRRHTRLQGDWSSDVCSSDLPPCVADAECSLGPVGGEQGLEISDLAGRLPDVERHPRDGGNPSRVIAAVLQPTKTRKDEGDSVPMADVADDSTHRRAVLTRPLAGCSPSGRRYYAEEGSQRPREGLSWDSPGL